MPAAFHKHNYYITPSIILAAAFAITCCATAYAASALVGPPLLDDDSDHARVLTKAEIVELQLRLNFLGFDAGRADGSPNNQTMKALRLFASTLNFEPVLTLKLLTLLRAGSAVIFQGREPQPSCKEGIYRTAQFYESPQALQVWGAPLDRVPWLLKDGDWVEVKCRNEFEVERAETYRSGQLTSVWRFTYAGNMAAPIQMQSAAPDGKLQAGYLLGRNPAGAITFIRPYGPDGSSSRHVAILPKDDGARWIFISREGSIISEYHCEYENKGQISTIDIISHLPGSKTVTYRHFYDPKTQFPDRSEKYEGSVKIHDAVYTRDEFGRTLTEKLVFTEAGPKKYNNRLFEKGLLVRDESEDRGGTRHLFEFINKGGVYAGSRFYRNGSLVGTFSVVRNGAEIVETRFHLADGRHYATYPGREVRYFADGSGRPEDGGEYKRHLKRRLW